jgi:polyisoprenoid-binding protein YceI
MMKLACLLAASLALLWALPAMAAPQSLALRPGSAQIAFRAYGLGLLPIDGAFTRFDGTLLIDNADPAVCRIDIKAEAASLQMPDAAMTQDALGADLLDVARHPAFAFSGQCRDGRVHGDLLLHGISRPLTLDVSLDRGRWIATGRMRRADWGMGARPLLAGPEVRIRFTAALPAGFPAAFPRRA